MAGSLAAKLGVKDGMRALLVNAPAEAMDSLRSPGLDIASEPTGPFEYIHVFVTSQAELTEQFIRLKDLLAPTGMLWISWPKGRKLNTDLTIMSVIKIGYDHGLVESKCISVDATWSALKFTLPIPGKVYNNKYGRLKRS